MDQFDFARLTDVDFEEICRDLLARHLEISLEIFKKGKDGGVDLRHLADNDRLTVVQCKHMLASGGAALLRKLRSQEMPKVRRMDPDRYIITTTCPLSATQKAKLLEDCKPYIVRPSDIFGGEDIASLLRDNDDIVKRHLRLWLSSSTVLEVIVNRDIYLRSQDLAEDVAEAARRYVPNESYHVVRQLLSQKKVSIISGEPGIGKTTLARIVAASYASEGYEIIDISHDSSEINGVWDDRRKQLYYYDDFLGRNFLAEMLLKNEDSRLLRLMERVQKGKDKKFLLTTRDYFLQRARQQYDSLDHGTFNPLTCTVTLNDYTFESRAQILYNHVYHSSIPAAEKVRFGEPRVSLPIVRHLNYNPRVIESALKTYSANLGEDTAAEHLVKSLDSPREIWSHVVSNQLSTAAVDVLEILLALSPRAATDVVTKTWVQYREASLPRDERELRMALKVLEGSLIRINYEADDDVQYLSYANPSIRDYMRDYCIENTDTIGRLLKMPRRFEVVENIWNIVSSDDTDTILPYLKKRSTDFLSYVAHSFQEAPLSGRFVTNNCSRLRLMVEISLAFSQRYFDEFLLRQIESLDEAPWRPFSSDVRILYLALEAHPDERFVEAGKAIVDDAIDRAVKHLDSDSFGFSQLALSELHDLPRNSVPQATFETVENRLHEMATDAFAKWPAGEIDLSPVEVEQLIEYANTFDYPAEEFQGYSVLNEHYSTIEFDVDEEQFDGVAIAAPHWQLEQSKAINIITALREYEDPTEDLDTEES